MKSYNRYFIVLALTFSVINIILAFLGQARLEVYFIIDALAFLVITLSFRFNARALTALNTVGAVILVGFIYVVALKVIDML
ncbi:MAG: hypothetical protein PHU23_10215 [Dehalococcoidales bacterium]|nr:hypothetical protein [Dehalococcoidales bacterium]